MINGAKFTLTEIPAGAHAPVEADGIISINWTNEAPLRLRVCDTEVPAATGTFAGNARTGMPSESTTETVTVAAHAVALVIVRVTAPELIVAPTTWEPAGVVSRMIPRVGAPTKVVTPTVTDCNTSTKSN